MPSIGSGTGSVSSPAHPHILERVYTDQMADKPADPKVDYDYPMRAPVAPLKTYAAIPTEVTAEILRLRSEAAEVAATTDPRSDRTTLPTSDDITESIATIRNLENPQDSPSLDQQI
ncbi:hypothetical protein [Actibacterium sp. 188UL27-1]|uniref:hypothetical protein n=1 Tax=Actibacterium sp. 188UL27-1 TaxID=2786961 RepID=UPI001959EEF4|nr:hypothetical protein [Actibacterium sp. 188UL27-1]MBM7068322.1 hypothetical protein [Actibacterium sp. 188UL27-1]